MLNVKQKLLLCEHHFSVIRCDPNKEFYPPIDSARQTHKPQYQQKLEM